MVSTDTFKEILKKSKGSKLFASPAGKSLIARIEAFLEKRGKK